MEIEMQPVLELSEKFHAFLYKPGVKDISPDSFGGISTLSW